MADKGDDFFLESEYFDISRVIQIQAALRGALVRKWMKQVKQAFEETFEEIERNPAVGVEWKPDQLGKPKVIRTKDSQKHEKRKKEADIQENDESNVCMSKNTKVTNSRNIKPVSKGQDKANTIKEKVTAEVQVSAESDLSIIDQSSKVAESPRYNSVEIQTSFIDVNSQTLPFKSKQVLEELDDRENNILEDLDTSWKDRVEPFIRNNFGEVEHLVEPEKDVSIADELHLDLDIDAESLQSHRSQRSSNIPYKHLERTEDSVRVVLPKATNNVKSAETVDNVSDRDRTPPRSDMSGKSECSQKSSVRKHDRDEVTYKGQRSNRSDDQRSETRGKRSHKSPEDQENGEMSDRKSNCSESRSQRGHLSGRSDKSIERCQNLYETERFSPRSQRSNESQISESKAQRSRGSEKASEGHLTQRSDRSEGRRPKSQRSDGSLSNRSDRSEDRNSQRSRDSESQRSRKSERIEKSDKIHPQPSRTSPVAFKQSTKEVNNDEGYIQGRPPLQDSTSLTNVTSVWDSFNSMRESHDLMMPKPLPQDTTQLKELRKNIAMELLWVQQAIDSRKNYLKLKGKM